MIKKIMKEDVPGKRSRGRPKQRWIQDVIDKFNMTVTETVHLIYDKYKFRRIIMVVKFCLGQATR
uniref:Uncharacterized protein n=1 Tax=Arion vulgaris TaxID=1028688 RepID=A0A0B6XZD5_9EUPU